MKAWPVHHVPVPLLLYEHEDALHGPRLHEGVRQDVAPERVQSEVPDGQNAGMLLQM